MSLQHGPARARFEPPVFVRAFTRRALDLVLPPHALDEGVDRPLASGLSAAAWSAVTWVEAPVCDGCGAPFAYDIGARCAACLARPRAFARARAASLYGERTRELILKLKHGDRTDLARLFALWLNRAAAELLADAEAILPVPLHPRRLFARRYNQAAEIARPLAALARVAYLPDTLRRARDTGGQRGRSRRGRREAVRGAFSVPPRLAGRIAGRRLLLIDDVMTTGATAEACARALLKAGAAAVDVAVVARVEDGRDLSI